MKAFNEIVVGTITKFGGTDSLDKNGEETVMILVRAGKWPNRNTIAGTLAKRAGLEIGKTYLLSVRETGYDDDFGTAFTWDKVQEITNPVDVIKVIKEIGESQMITIPKPENNYQRITTAVESLQTKRIKENKFHPVTGKSYEHANAEVIDGTSVTDKDANTKALFPKAEERLNK